MQNGTKMEPKINQKTKPKSRGQNDASKYSFGRNSGPLRIVKVWKTFSTSGRNFEPKCTEKDPKR